MQGPVAGGIGQESRDSQMGVSTPRTVESPERQQEVQSLIKPKF